MAKVIVKISEENAIKCLKASMNKHNRELKEMWEFEEEEEGKVIAVWDYNVPTMADFYGILGLFYKDIHSFTFVDRCWGFGFIESKLYEGKLIRKNGNVDLLSLRMYLSEEDIEELTK